MSNTENVNERRLAEQRFPDNTTGGTLEFQGKPLAEGDVIEICILGHWLPGRLALDSTGWYLITPDHVGIRLLPGNLARWPEGTPLLETRSSEMGF